MSTRRVYIPEDRIRGGVALPPPDQCHHLRNVLRLSPGDAVEVFDGTGRLYVGRFDSGGGIVIRNLQTLRQPEPDSPPLILAAALIRPSRFEWMLEKATELGADQIVPLKTRFSEIHYAGKAQNKSERWHRIVVQACEQCGRILLPLIHPPTDLGEWLAREDCSHFARLLCYEKGGTPWNRLRLPPGPVAVCIGPEGGWDQPELDAALRSGYELVSLGPRTLRAETAALAAVVLIQCARP
jgi:16S rRNA (uracil1498-N3)-methyltransferase